MTTITRLAQTRRILQFHRKMTTKTRVNNDIDIAWRQDGNLSGPPVLFAHSLMCDHRMWDAAVSKLGDKYKLIRYDARGHGSTMATEPPYSIDTLAKDASGLLDALEIPKAHFVGLSIGGMVGQRLGIDYGEKIKSLVLANTSSTRAAPGVWDQRMAAVKKDGIESLVEPTINRWFTQEFIKKNPPGLETIRSAMRNTSLNGYLGCGAAVRDMDNGGKLGLINAPTLVISAAHDAGTTAEHGKALADGIAGSKFLLIEDASHLSAVEQPDIFYAAVREFLDGVEGSESA